MKNMANITTSMRMMGKDGHNDIVIKFVNLWNILGLYTVNQQLELVYQYIANHGSI